MCKSKYKIKYKYKCKRMVKCKYKNKYEGEVCGPRGETIDKSIISLCVPHTLRAGARPRPADV